MNMPTRRELDTTHKRVHGLQRQLSALQDALEDITPAEAQASEQRPAARTAPAARKAAPRAARNPAKRRVQPKKKR
jgi:hypothetical protein